MDYIHVSNYLTVCAGNIILGYGIGLPPTAKHIKILADKPCFKLLGS